MSMALQKMGNVLTEVEGVWTNEETNLRPVSLRYVRSQLGQKLGGASLKEAITLGSALDLLAQGRVAEAGDYLTQRLKSLEKISQGVSWQTSERLELAPGVTPQISTIAEMQAVKREAKLDTEHRVREGKEPREKDPRKGRQKRKARASAKSQEQSLAQETHPREREEGSRSSRKAVERNQAIARG